jgi:para-nitrobenzyl esterase
MKSSFASIVSGAYVSGALTLLILTPVVSAAAARPEVVTTDGTVRGTLIDGFDMFRGIPYAAPPLGPLRWRAAQKSQPWKGVRDATDFGADCEQPANQPGMPAPPSMNEDCLTINVLTPSTGRSKKLPVMVWIHGGAYFVGSGRFPLDVPALNLARQGVVLVTLNYRLGRFGFFAHPALANEHPGETVGNYFLSDQIAALQWVQKNIAQFGGDPANVTIFGCSAGGSSVNLLIAARQARGLFARGIVESGGGLFNASRPLAKAQDEARVVATRAGADGDSPAGLQKLRSMTPQQVLANEQGPPDYGAIVDGVVLTDSLPVLFAKGDINPVSYLAGSTSNEASIFGLMGFDAAVMEKRFDIRVADVRPVYEATSRLPDAELLRQIQTDFIFTAGSGSLATFAAKNGHPAYVYQFAYVDQAHRGKIPGVPHGGEISYLFDVAPTRVPQDEAIATLMQGYWINFAKKGDPNGPGLPNWPLYRTPAPATLVVNDQTAAVPEFRRARLKVWYDEWSKGSGVSIPQ